MLLYSTTISPRLKYVCDFIGNEITGDTFQLTSDTGIVKTYAGAKINYSEKRISADEFWIKPHTLLFEKDIHQQNIECFVTNNQKVFFKTDGDFSFDIFASLFYLLSRYEEYLPHQQDIYGRYAHENSLAYQQKFLHLPLINIWLATFKKAVEKKYSISDTQNASFRFIPTYDIDEAFSYKHKGLLRTAGGIGKAFLKGEWARISERRKVISGALPDPFDSYEWMDILHKQYRLHPRYFFLVPQKTGKYDRNIPPAEEAQQQLIRQHAEKYETGIHPSWQSGDDPLLIKKEIRTLETITGKRITASRQHFIRLTLPQTYRYLIDAGIREEFSMGYGSINGFRASVASPFYWYDLEREETTSLLLYPFCFMDANSFFEQKYSPQQALEEMRHYYKEVKAVNGTLITLWHNTFLGTDKLFEGWREVYEQFIKEVMDKDSTVS